MTRSDGERTPGYRGALPTRADRLARPWVAAVIGAFLLVLVLSVLGVPSRFIPDPTPMPLPSIVLPTPSEEASASPEESGEATPDASAAPEESTSAQPAPTDQ